MGYAIRNDGQGWRAVNSAAECAAHEIYSDTQPAPVAANPRVLLQRQARAALEVTDRVAHRCYKAGVPFPATWQTYTIALRNIANGTDTASAALPAPPAYPAGT